MTSLLDTARHAGSPLPPSKRSRRKRVALVFVSVMVLLLGAVFAWYLINRKPLSQLPGMPGGSAPHYLFSMYGVSRPLGVAVNQAGDRVYVTQSDGPRVVQVYDGAGHPLGTLKPPASTGTNHVPLYVAVNPTTQDVYVSDRLANAVYVYDAAGKYQRTVDTAKAKLAGSWKPLGLAFGSDGTLYVTDLGPPQRIVAIAPDGASSHTFGEKDGLSFANGIAVDADGEVLVADSNNSRLLVYGSSETVAATLTPGTGAGSLGLPRGVAVGDGHRLYVVDTTDHMVRLYKLGSDQGDVPEYVASFGREGGIDGAFEYPNGVAVDSHARVYVTDRENLRVQVWGY